MDETLAEEITEILTVEDENAQCKYITKIMFYLLTLPVPPRAYHPIIEQLVERAFEVLPSSHLPQQLAKKLGISKRRRKMISFSPPTFFALKSPESLSSEGKAQQARESRSLSIANTDPLRRFSPKDCFIEGMSTLTRHAFLLPCNLSNTFNPELKASIKRSGRPTASLSEILQDPSILEMYI